MQIHPSLVQIAEDVLAGKQRRAKVRTLMGYFSLKKEKVSRIAINPQLPDRTRYHHDPRI